MTSDEILEQMAERYPALLPWSDEVFTPVSARGMAHELAVLIGSWDRVDEFLHPEKASEPCGKCEGTGAIVEISLVSWNMLRLAVTEEEGNDGKVEKVPETAPCPECRGEGRR